MKHKQQWNWFSVRAARAARRSVGGAPEPPAASKWAEHRLPNLLLAFLLGLLLVGELALIVAAKA